MSNQACDQYLQAAAYLLDALEPAEAERYRQHLQGCASCREEIDQLAPAIRALPATVASSHASDALIQKVMTNVRAEAELLAAASPHADRPRPAHSRWRATLLGAATALVAAAIAAVLILTSSASERISQARLAGNTPGHAQVRQRDGRAELLVAGIPPPPAGEIYQIWLAKPHGAPQPTDALFGVNSDGNATVNVPGNLHKVATLMVTAEPAGGSQHPTSPPIIIANLNTT